MNQPILIISSIESFMTAICSELNEEGYFVVQATSKSEAVDAIATGVYDLVLIENQTIDRDIKLLCRMVKEVSEETHILLVMAQSIENSYDFCDEYAVSRIYNISEKVSVISKAIAHLTDALANSDSSVPSVIPPPESRPTGVEVQEDYLMRLALDYRQRIPTEMSELMAMLKDGKANPNNEDLIMDIRRKTHTISGTAGTLGFSGIGEIAKEINARIKQLHHPQANVTHQWNTIFQLMQKAMGSQGEPDFSPPRDANTAGIATLLVIDEDKSSLKHIQKVAENCFVTLVPAISREQALLRTVRSQIDGAIIDLDMDPPEKPFEIAYDLRNLDGKHSLSIAFMSKNGSMPNRVAAASAGATQFLSKPILEHDLLDVAKAFGQFSLNTEARVLLIDKDPEFRSYIRGILEEKHVRVKELPNPSAVLETMEQFNPSMVLLDVQFPHTSGLDVCRMLRSIAAWKKLPILFLTSESSTDARIECFNAGCDDYIQKPCIKEELLARIEVRLDRIRMFNEQTDIDPLTHLLNRRTFLEQFRQKKAEGLRTGDTLSFCLIDLDNFKSVNNTYGHLTGDRVLKEFGRLLSSRFRSFDLRGRWAGNEFALAFFKENSKTSQMLLSRIQQRLLKTVFTGDNGKEFHLSFSAGVATFPTDGEDFETIFRKADHCLFQAKENGKNRIYTLEDLKKK